MNRFFEYPWERGATIAICAISGKIRGMQTLQQSMDDFVQNYAEQHGSQLVETAAQCMEMLALYLIHYSDMFPDAEYLDEGDLAEWEQGLEQHMSDLLEGDTDPAADLGTLPLEALEPAYLRDFLGWFVVRESGDSELVEAYVDVLQHWVDYVQKMGLWQPGQYVAQREVIAEVGEEAVRVAKLSRVLLHYVRLGSGMPPRLRGKRFSRFIEGHGRVVSVDAQSITLDFDSRDELAGPLNLPRAILDLIEFNDVFDVELGMRGDAWVMVDIGPVYPACVYVEPEEFRGLDKRS